MPPLNFSSDYSIEICESSDFVPIQFKIFRKNIIPSIFVYTLSDIPYWHILIGPEFIPGSELNMTKKIALHDMDAFYKIIKEAFDAHKQTDEYKDTVIFTSPANDVYGVYVSHDKDVLVLESLDENHHVFYIDYAFTTDHKQFDSCSNLKNLITSTITSAHFNRENENRLSQLEIITDNGPVYFNTNNSGEIYTIKYKFNGPFEIGELEKL